MSQAPLPGQVAEPLEITLHATPKLRRALWVERSYLGQIHIVLQKPHRAGSASNYVALAASHVSRHEVEKIRIHQHSSGLGWSLWVGSDVHYALTETEAKTLADAFGFRVDRRCDAGASS
jgi:hypothetical protein